MDGVTHINIYSKGRTTLGQALSNFSDTPIDTLDGQFRSIEGYWYYLGTDHPSRVIFRDLFGSEAKLVGRQLKALDWQDSPVFKLKIYSAMLTKLILHDSILSEFQKNKLPFRHYYAFGGKICEPKEGKWIIDMWSFLQEQLCT